MLRRTSQDDAPRKPPSKPPSAPPSGGSGSSRYIGGYPDDYKPIGRRIDHSARALEREKFGRPPEVITGPGTMRYVKGDEWRIGGNLSPARIAIVQQQLAQAGLFAQRSRFTPGVWDAVTANAFKRLLEAANGQGRSWQETLYAMVRGDIGVQVGADGSLELIGAGGAQEHRYVPPPLHLRTTNPDDLRKVFRQAVIDTMGQGWSKEKIDELVEAYNWKEIQLQTDAYRQRIEAERRAFENPGAVPAGGDRIHEVMAPSPETFIEDQMIAQDREGYEAGRIVNEMVPAFMQMLRGWV